MPTATSYCVSGTDQNSLGPKSHRLLSSNSPLPPGTFSKEMWPVLLPCSLTVRSLSFHAPHTCAALFTPTFSIACLRYSRATAPTPAIQSPKSLNHTLQAFPIRSLHIHHPRTPKVISECPELCFLLTWTSLTHTSLSSTAHSQKPNHRSP